MEENGLVLYQEDNSIARLRLNRPDALNALNAELRADLMAALEKAQRSREVRVIVITGNGKRAFCAGADLKRSRPPTLALRIIEDEEERRWIDVLAFDVSKPIICGIHGYCLGGGLELALACDIRIATAGATLGLPEVTRGVIPGAGGTQRLADVVGAGIARQMVLTGETITAAEALRIGLVSRVVEEEELDAALDACAKRIADNAPLAVQLAKIAMRGSRSGQLREGMELERRLSQLISFTSDRKEAAEAFREGRKPRFRGE